MTKYDEYCYNLMENAIKQGSERHGLPQEECVALMNIMLGVRGVESYIDSTSKTEETEDREIKEALKVATERTQVIPAADCAVAANKLGKKLADFKKEREDDINGETMGD